MYGEHFLYGAERPVNNTAVYRATTDIDIKVSADSILPETISQGDYFSINEAPVILQEKLALAVKVGFAEEIEVVETFEVVEELPMTPLEQLETKVEEVLGMDSDDIVDGILKSNEIREGANVVPDIIDGKISRASSAVVDSIDIINQAKEESNLDKFRKKKKSVKKESKLDKFRRQKKC